MKIRDDHYLVLDAGRGVAALCVFLFHLQSSLFPEGSFYQLGLLSKSYLAVDLFFLMSGLVIAKAYSERLQSGAMKFKSFLFIRLLRLYPLYLAGLLLGVSYLFIRWALTGEELPAVADMIRSLILNALFLPDLWSAKGIFMFNQAAWSLSLEWIINLIYAVFAVSFANRTLFAILAASAIALIVSAFYEGGLDTGWAAYNFYSGLLRITFSFTLGMLLYRYKDRLEIKNSCLPWWFSLFCILILLSNPLGIGSLYYDLLCAIVLFPILVIMAADAKAPKHAQYVCYLFGLVSYGLYILHTPLIMWTSGVWKQLAGNAPDEDPYWAALFIIPTILIASWLATIAYDQPVRKMIKNKVWHFVSARRYKHAPEGPF